jgi:hypothetical protein
MALEVYLKPSESGVDRQLQELKATEWQLHQARGRRLAGFHPRARIPPPKGEETTI